MNYTAETLPSVDPMMIRKFITHGTLDVFGGIILLSEVEAVDLYIADSRFSTDEDVVDCSNRIFEITTNMMLQHFKERRGFMAFPGRRRRDLTHTPSGVWESMNGGPTIPPKGGSFLYIGNPIRLFSDPEEGIIVMRSPEFLIKSGPQLGY